jgi:hypothetical protein
VTIKKGRLSKQIRSLGPVVTGLQPLTDTSLCLNQMRPGNSNGLRRDSTVRRRHTTPWEHRRLAVWRIDGHRNVWWSHRTATLASELLRSRATFA